MVKRFGSSLALGGADFSCGPGEVHLLLGENGAGKSTLMNVLMGLVKPDAGTIEVQGREVRFGSPREAIAAGIGMVHQHFTVVPAMTVAENVWLGRSGAWYDRKAAREAVRAVAAATSLALEPDVRADALPVGLLQRLEIVKTLASEVKVLILDEPTAALTPAESDQLLVALRRLALRGVAVILITHKLRETTAADRVTVLRRGATVLTGPSSAYDSEALAAAMVGGTASGEELGEVLEMPRKEAGGSAMDRCLVVKDLVVRGARGAVAVAGASFVVNRGEILGIAAVEGNGHRELLRAVAGLLPWSGVIELSGGCGFVPEDRQREGLILDFPVEANLSLGERGGFWLRLKERRRAAQRALEAFDMQPADPRAPARALSGGNQQKLVLARELARAPALLVLENPARGLDVHAAFELHQKLRRAAREDGLGALYYSSDLDEVLLVADRVAVMERGRWHDVPPESRRREQLGALMAGGSA